MKSDLITSDPEVMMGKPVVRGARITVEMILEKLSEGESVEQIIEAHPRLTEEGGAGGSRRPDEPWRDYAVGMGPPMKKGSQ